jgi:AraC-like DNA-binding protein
MEDPLFMLNRPNPSSAITMDPLSDALSLLNPRSSLSSSLEAGGDWAMDFPRYQGVKFNAVMRGACWLTLQEHGQPIWLEVGDCFLLTDGRPFRLGTRLDLEPVDARVVFAAAQGGVARHGQGAGVFLIGGRFTFDEDAAGLLLDNLPPVFHISAARDEASVLRWVLEHLAEELGDTHPGASLMAAHLTHILLVQALRAFLASEERPASGWLAALSDPKIGAAIRLMHASPARRWTLAELAQAAGMSRTAFALQFKAKVNVAPLNYLLRWRMRLAAQALRTSNRTVSSIALSLGYDSESAFSSAFKRVTMHAPLHYRQAHAK